jgi:hypothetical protein
VTSSGVYIHDSHKVYYGIFIDLRVSFILFVKSMVYVQDFAFAQ